MKKVIVIVLISFPFCVMADDGIIDRSREFESIKERTMIDGRPSYPHGFHTNKTIQSQLSIQNSAEVDTIGAKGIRYQIKNPYGRNKEKKKAKKRGFTFSDMAKKINNN